MPERWRVSANWQRWAALETMGPFLSLLLPFCECQVSLAGNIFLPFPNCLLYCVHNEVNTGHLSPRARVGSPDQPWTVPPFASSPPLSGQHRAGHPVGL